MADQHDWEWSSSARRFRDLRDGQFVSAREIVAMRNGLADSRLAVTDALSELLARGDLSVQRWTLEMRETIRLTHYTEYVFGRGGLNAMTQADWGKLGPIVKDQYEYLQGFANDIASGRYLDADGNVSGRAIAARARMYVNAGVNTFSQALESAWGGGLQLPCHPGDGGTPCISNCRCYWVLSETRSKYRALWRLGAAEHCSGCLARAAMYSPFEQTKPPEVSETG